MTSHQTLDNNIPAHTEGKTCSAGNPEGIIDNRQRYDPNYSAAGTTDPHGHNTNSIPRDPLAGEKNRPSDPNSFGPSTGPDSRDLTSPNTHTEEPFSNLGDKRIPAGKYLQACFYCGVLGVVTRQHGGATAGVKDLQDHDSNSTPHNRPSDPSPLMPSTGPDSQSPRDHIQARLSKLGKGSTAANGAPDVATGQHNPTASVTNSHEHDSVSPLHNILEGKTNYPPNSSSPKPFTGSDTRDSMSSGARIQERSSHSGDKLALAGGMPGVATGQHTSTPGVTNSRDHDSVSTAHNLPEGKTNRPSNPSSPKPSTGPDTRNSTSSDAHIQERSLISGDKITPAGGVPNVADGQHNATAGVANFHDHNSSSTSHNPPKGERLHPSGPKTSDPSTGPDLHHPKGPSAHTKEHSSNLDNKTTPAGGVRPDAATGHNRENRPANVSLFDKVIGAAEEVAGRITHNPERTERGQLRGIGGVAAVHGGARAPHA